MNLITGFYLRIVFVTFTAKKSGIYPPVLKASAFGLRGIEPEIAFNREILNKNILGTYFKKSVKQLVELIYKAEKEIYCAEECLRKLNNDTWKVIENQYDTIFDDTVGANA